MTLVRSCKNEDAFAENMWQSLPRHLREVPEQFKSNDEKLRLLYKDLKAQLTNW